MHHKTGGYHMDATTINTIVGIVGIIVGLIGIIVGVIGGVNLSTSKRIIKSIKADNNSSIQTADTIYNGLSSYDVYEIVSKSIDNGLSQHEQRERKHRENIKTIAEAGYCICGCNQGEAWHQEIFLQNFRVTIDVQRQKGFFILKVSDQDNGVYKEKRLKNLSLIPATLTDIFHDESYEPIGPTEIESGDAVLVRIQKDTQVIIRIRELKGILFAVDYAVYKDYPTISN